MDEVLPGVRHWTARHPKIGIVVSSYWLPEEGVLFDPLVPPQGFAALDAAPPNEILLSNRHHLRESARFVERYGCSVHCNRAGLHEFAGGEVAIEGFDLGERLAGGAIAAEMGAICPDDTALYLPAHRAIVLADGIVRGGEPGAGGPLGFVPDSLMDDPPETKRGLLASCSRLLAEFDFDSLLLAHGGPVIGDGRALLEDVVTSGGRTAFEM